jgi:hypothetical protein
MKEGSDVMRKDNSRPARPTHAFKSPEETRDIRRALGAWFDSQEIGFEDALIVMGELVVDVLTLNATSRADLDAGKAAFVHCVQQWTEERKADFAN